MRLKIGLGARQNEIDETCKRGNMNDREIDEQNLISAFRGKSYLLAANILVSLYAGSDEHMHFNELLAKTFQTLENTLLSDVTEINQKDGNEK